MPSGADCESRQSHRQTRVSNFIPANAVGIKFDTKPDYNNLIFLKSSVVEGEGMGSGVARQHGGTVFSIFMSILSDEYRKRPTPFL